MKKKREIKPLENIIIETPFKCAQLEIFKPVKEKEGYEWIIWYLNNGSYRLQTTNDFGIELMAMEHFLTFAKKWKIKKFRYGGKDIELI